MRERLSSREILFEEEARRDERNENLHDIDLLLDATIRRAEEGKKTKILQCLAP